MYKTAVAGMWMISPNLNITNLAQISIPKPIADACDLRNNSEVVVTKVSLIMCYNLST
jgi:hypothetical protein